MTIDNSPVAVNDRKMMYIMAISLTLAIPTIMLSDFFDEPVLGIQKEFYALALGVAYFIINLYRYILDLNYINFSTDNNKVTLKYFSLRPFHKQRKSIEFPGSNLAKFEINNSFFGLKHNLILYQRMQGKLAKYPPVSLSGLNNDELENLRKMLNQLVSKK